MRMSRDKKLHREQKLLRNATSQLNAGMLVGRITCLGENLTNVTGVTATAVGEVLSFNNLCSLVVDRRWIKNYDMLRIRVSPAYLRAFRRGKHRVSPEVESIIRVDHAGEFGADRIYAGQMAVLGNSAVGPKIQEMWEQEKGHRAEFEKLIVEHRVRPTVFLPLWNVAGFALGAATALLGEKGAMACTVAVESVIVDHYNDQLRELTQEESKLTAEQKEKLCEVIQKFRDDEQEHHDTGIKYGALEAPFYETITSVIKFGSKVAIEMSKRF